MALPKWAKIYEKLEKRACGTLKIKDAVANVAIRVANAPKKGQARRNTTLLGKYRIHCFIHKGEFHAKDTRLARRKSRRKTS